jgi:hypothetical protein
MDGRARDLPTAFYAARLFALPAGPVALVVGSEYGSDSLDYSSLVLGRTSYNNGFGNHHRESFSLFGERPGATRVGRPSVTQGGKPNLKPETGASWTVGGAVSRATTCGSATCPITTIRDVFFNFGATSVAPQ